MGMTLFRCTISGHLGNLQGSTLIVVWTRTRLLPQVGPPKIKNTWFSLCCRWSKEGLHPHSALTWKKITNELHDRIGRVQYTKLQVKQMIDRLKANYKDFTMLLSGKVGTGFGWDHSSNTVTNSEDNWEQLKHVSNNSKSLSIYNFSNPNL
jgi:hypothetical protein